ncbi:MAG: HAMP domain-containing protein [Eubacterium sp.]|nr:HAMP domain-containing protein [Eubacterium sp.]
MTFLIVAVMLLSVIAAGVFGTLFLEKYYTKQKQSAVKQVYKTFDKVVKKDAAFSESDDIQELNGILEKTGASAIVINNSGVALYTYGSEMPLRQRWRDLVFGFGDDKRFKSEVVEKNSEYNLLYTEDPSAKTYHYELVSELSNESDLVVRLSVENFKESLSITNHFYAGLAIVLIVIITILMIVVTRRYTIPMLQLASISKKMSELDFDVKYEGKHDDELGVLGDSMNEMSEKLESTITELKTANLELEKDIKQKEEVDELRKEFISNVSHELKTPIAFYRAVLHFL